MLFFLVLQGEEIFAKKVILDIAVYFYPEKDIEWEAFQKRYKEELIIGLELERLLKKEID